MPRIVKKLPPNRADYTFGDLVYWHLFEYGTRRTGDPSRKIGDPWDPDDFCQLLDIDLRTLRNWIGDKNIPDDKDVAIVAQNLFGQNSLFEDAKAEFWLVLKETRLRNAARRKASKAKRTVPAQPAAPIAETPPSHGDATGPPPHASGNLPVVQQGRAAAIRSDEEDDGEIDAAYDAEQDTWYVPASWKAQKRENSGKVSVIPPEVFNARPGTRRIRRAPIVVAGIALLLGGYAWTRQSPEKPTPPPPGTDTSIFFRGADKTDPAPKDEKEKSKTANLPAADGDKAADNEAAARAAEAAKAKARAQAEQRFQIAATKDAVEQKRLDERANAQALNAKLKILAQADGTVAPADRTAAQTDENDLCKQKLAGVSVPGFDLKCDTLIPFGAMLGSVPVSQTASSLGDCAARCRKVVSPKCVAFSFDAGAHNGSASCYLTGSIPGFNAATNWIAGTR